MSVSHLLEDPLVVRPVRRLDGILTRGFGGSLDAALAAGRPPESSRLLAARARHTVALRRRRSLAANWEHLLDVARRRAGDPPAAVPVRAADIAAAAPAIAELVTRLIAPLPVPARGVAMASVLLTDGAGPVYRRGGPVTLAVALEAAIAALDPALPLMPAAR